MKAEGENETFTKTVRKNYTFVIRQNSNDKKCINKEERVRHLPGYCP